MPFVHTICEIDVSALVNNLDCLKWLPAGGRPDCYAMLQEWPATFLVEPIFDAIMKLYPDRYRGNTMISCLVPGQYIEPHRDHHESSCDVRIHVPLLTNPSAIFVVETEASHMEVGKVYRIDPNNLHSAANAGKTDRIHLIFNMVK